MRILPRQFRTPHSTLHIQHLSLEVLSMKARGSRFMIILGGGLAALAFVVVYLVMSRGQATPPADNPAANVPQQEQMRTVAVAAADLPPYTVLDQTNVATEDVVASTVESNTTSNPADPYATATMVRYV